MDYNNVHVVYLFLERLTLGDPKRVTDYKCTLVVWTFVCCSHTLCLIAGPPVNVSCNIFINSFGSIAETTMVSNRDAASNCTKLTKMRNVFS